MKAHLTNTHLLAPRSRSSAKVKVKYQGHVSQKMGVSGALVFHKHFFFQIWYRHSSWDVDRSLMIFMSNGQRLIKTLYSIDTHLNASTTDSF